MPEPPPTSGFRIPLPLALLILAVVAGAAMVGGFLLRHAIPSTAPPAPKGAAGSPSGAAKSAPPGTPRGLPGPRVDADPGGAERDHDSHRPRSLPKLPVDFRRPSDLIARIRPLLEGDEDGEVLDAAREALETWLAADPGGQALSTVEGRARELLDLFRQETDERVLEILASALGSDAASQNDPAVVQGFLGVARDDAESARRLHAMLFLSDVTEIPAWLAEQMPEVVRAETDPDVRSLGIIALNSWLDVDAPGREGIVAALLESAKTDAEPDNRKAALDRLTARDAGPAGTGEILRILRADAEASVRRRAARALAAPLPAARTLVLEELEKAYLAESDAKVRKTIAESLVAAGRRDAIDPLTRLAAADPAAATTLRDYAEILATGETDPDRIKELMKLREKERKTKTVK